MGLFTSGPVRPDWKNSKQIYLIHLFWRTLQNDRHSGWNEKKVLQRINKNSINSVSCVQFLNTLKVVPIEICPSQGEETGAFGKHLPRRKLCVNTYWWEWSGATQSWCHTDIRQEQIFWLKCTWKSEATNKQSQIPKFPGQHVIGWILFAQHLIHLLPLPITALLSALDSNRGRRCVGLSTQADSCKLTGGRLSPQVEPNPD